MHYIIGSDSINKKKQVILQKVVFFFLLQIQDGFETSVYTSVVKSKAVDLSICNLV